MPGFPEHNRLVKKSQLSLSCLINRINPHDRKLLLRSSIVSPDTIAPLFLEAKLISYSSFSWHVFRRRVSQSGLTISNSIIKFKKLPRLLCDKFKLLRLKSHFTD